MKTFLASCNFPSTVLLIDDSSRFLRSLSMQLIDNLPYLSYQDPKQALDFLNNNYRHKTLYDCLLQDLETGSNHKAVSFNISEIYKKIYDPRRYREVTLLIVDYAMPSLNGIDFCEQVKSPWLKKIMLTGEADEGIAVQAFNKGIIDRFVKKSDLNLANVLSETVIELQNQYFIDFTNSALNHHTRSASSSQSLCCLTDPEFAEYFKKLCHEHRIKEYYLMDAYGCFLLLNAQGKMSFLIVKNDAEMDEFTQYALQAEHVPYGVMDALTEREKVPHFFNETELATPPHKWHEHLYPATSLRGQCCHYYVAYLPELKQDYFNQEKVLSYQDFLSAKN